MIIPEAFKRYRQFIPWIAVPSKTRPGKVDKFPVDQYGKVVDAHDPANHMSYDEVVATRRSIGFVFTENDPFFFLDIDEALQAGQWSPLAIQLCNTFQGCFIEVSQSGKGLHIFGSGAYGEHSVENKSISVGFYHADRFAALTGISASGNADIVNQPAIDWLISSYFPPREHIASAEWTDGPVPEWSGPEDDDELVKRMLASRGSAAAAFGGRASLRALWDADPDELGTAYPDPSREFDHSAADAALCQHLAFWTGKDCERMDRLFRLSALYREKWDRPDYQHRTILHAVGHCSKVYTQRKQTEQREGVIDGFQFQSVMQQVEHFAGCVYIRDIHRVFIPDGSILKPDQFRVTYGGYTFAVDHMADRTTRNAWEAFTESQGYRFPKVHSACFRPEHPPGEVIEEEGLLLVNTYVPIETLAIQGDPGKFIDLLSKLLPDPRDREILISYMAAAVQYPGVKFQWWPVIQGAEGNGKSAILRALEFAIGKRYSHLPNAESMAKTGNQFNGWVAQKLFVGVEEMYVPDRREFLEAFKTTVTNDRIQIEGKGENQVMGENRANGVICTNHKDGVPVTVDTRRYSIFFTAQQSKPDKIRDGMGGEYFPDLYDWLNGRGRYEPYGKNYGYAVINNWLRTYQIKDELNPARLCHEAPHTSSINEAIRTSLGGIEQEVLEAIEQDKPGFAGGWLSSFALDKLIDDRRIRMTQNKRRELAYGLGYAYHPALRDGRVNNPITDAGTVGKPRLYIKLGHLACNLTSPAEVVRIYQEAQNGNSIAGDAFGNKSACN